MTFASRPARHLALFLLLTACAPLPDLGGANPNPPPRPALQPLAPLLAVPAPEATAESAQALADRGKDLRQQAKSGD